MTLLLWPIRSASFLIGAVVAIALTVFLFWPWLPADRKAESKRAALASAFREAIQERKEELKKSLADIQLGKADEPEQAEASTKQEGAQDTGSSTTPEPTTQDDANTGNEDAGNSSPENTPPQDMSSATANQDDPAPDAGGASPDGQSPPPAAGASTQTCAGYTTSIQSAPGDGEGIVLDLDLPASPNVMTERTILSRYGLTLVAFVKDPQRGPQDCHVVIFDNNDTAMPRIVGDAVKHPVAAVYEPLSHAYGDLLQRVNQRSGSARFNGVGYLLTPEAETNLITKLRNLPEGSEKHYFRAAIDEKGEIRIEEAR